MCRKLLAKKIWFYLLSAGGKLGLKIFLTAKKIGRKFFVDQERIGTNFLLWPKKFGSEIFFLRKNLGWNIFLPKKISVGNSFLAQKNLVGFFLAQKIVLEFFTIGWSKNLLRINNINVDTFPGAAAAYLDEQRQLIWMSSGSLSG